MPIPASKRRTLLIAIPFVLLLGVLAFVFVRVQRSLGNAIRTAASLHQIPFTLRPLDAAALAAANPGFEPVAAPADFTSGVAFTPEGQPTQLYLAGASGLTIASSEGMPRQTLRIGIDLPVARITALAVGRPRGATQPQVMVATAGAGLLLFSGGAIAQLLPASSEARDLTAVLPLATGDVLLGTRHHGLLLFDGTALTSVPLPAHATDITVLASTGSASYLVGTRTAGVFYAQGGVVIQATTASGLPDNQVESMLVSANQAYVGTPLGIAQFDLTAPAFNPTRTLAPGRFAHALALAQGTLDIGTFDQGIEPLPLASTPRLRNVSIAAPRLDGLESDASTQRIDAFIPTANALYALADGVLLRQAGSGWSPPQAAPPATLADRNISALAFDPQGQLYVGFFDHGLDILTPDQPTMPPRHLETDHLFCINRLILDPTRHTIAAATANGLVLFDEHGTPRQTLTRRDGLISDHITDVAFTPGGAVLATPAGLTFLTPTGPSSLYAFQGLVNNHVYALASENNQLLAGTLGGISILESQQVRRNLTATNSSLKHNWITALLPTTPGSYLVGTYGSALQTLAPNGSFTSIDLPANTPKDLVINPNALLATPTHLYAGTLSQGMLVFTRATGRWQRITTGLPSLNVTAFAARAGVLYIGTENGLVRIPEARL